MLCIPRAVVAATPKRPLLLTMCILLLGKDGRDGERTTVGGPSGATKAAVSGHERAARRTAASTALVLVLPTATVECCRGWTVGHAEEKHEEKEEDEIVTILSRHFRVLLCFMGCADFVLPWTTDTAPCGVVCVSQRCWGSTDVGLARMLIILSAVLHIKKKNGYKKRKTL